MNSSAWSNTLIVKELDLQDSDSQMKLVFGTQLYVEARQIETFYCHHYVSVMTINMPLLQLAITPKVYFSKFKIQMVRSSEICKSYKFID